MCEYPGICDTSFYWENIKEADDLETAAVGMACGEERRDYLLKHTVPSAGAFQNSTQLALFESRLPSYLTLPKVHPHLPLWHYRAMPLYV